MSLMSNIKLVVASLILIVGSGYYWYSSSTIETLERVNSNLKTNNVVLERDKSTKEVEKKLQDIVRDKQIKIKEEIINEEIPTSIGKHRISF